MMIMLNLMMMILMMIVIVIVRSGHDDNQVRPVQRKTGVFHDFDEDDDYHYHLSDQTIINCYQIREVIISDYMIIRSDHVMELRTC